MKTAVLFSRGMKEYDLGHVLTGRRFDDFQRLFEEYFSGRPEIELIEPAPATCDDLRLVHTDEYIRRVERLEERDPFDTPLSEGLIRAAKLLAGAGKLAGELVWQRSCDQAIVIGGGVQHARRDREKGFGVFSDVGICAENLMRSYGARRILIVDSDAHAGDGIYAIFRRDPRVLTISIHQDPRTLYPGTGFLYQTGEGPGTGYSVNIPLVPGTSDMAYQSVMEEIFVPLAMEFTPEAILMIDGSDVHFTDQITDMALTFPGIRTIGRIVGETAREVCQGRVVDFSGSGYSTHPAVTPLGWLVSMAGVATLDFTPPEPEMPPDFNRDQGLGEAA